MPTAASSDQKNPGDRGDQPAQAELVQDTGHPGLGLGEALVGQRPVSEEQLHPFQGAGPVHGHAAGSVSAAKSLPTQDAQGGFLPAAAGDLASDYLLEQAGAEASGAAEVAAVAVDDHPERGDPGPGPERLPGALQRGRPDALEQVPHLLDLTAHLGEQLLAANTEMPQPGSGLIDRLGHIAAQLRGQPGDDTASLSSVLSTVGPPPAVTRRSPSA